MYILVESTRPWQASYKKNSVWYKPSRWKRLKIFVKNVLRLYGKQINKFSHFNSTHRRKFCKNKDKYKRERNVWLRILKAECKMTKIILKNKGKSQNVASFHLS